MSVGKSACESSDIMVSKLADGIELAGSDLGAGLRPEGDVNTHGRH